MERLFESHREAQLAVMKLKDNITDEAVEEAMDNAPAPKRETSAGGGAATDVEMMPPEEDILKWIEMNNFDDRAQGEIKQQAAPIMKRLLAVGKLPDDTKNPSAKILSKIRLFKEDLERSNMRGNRAGFIAMLDDRAKEAFLAVGMIRLCGGYVRCFYVGRNRSCGGLTRRLCLFQIVWVVFVVVVLSMLMCCRPTPSTDF